ncbi:MAG: flavohemoglobin expression-modulating QEGLA motif protein [Candidatus Saccharibacteria bacterium]|nr:flavohemoglobin expression-modulating QEGLA motif protein [Candidatus Saccharibacteria bacterium]
MFSIPKPELANMAAKAIAEIALQLNPVEIVTPINNRTEKQQWIAATEHGSFRNPSFTYDNERLLKIAILESELNMAKRQLLETIEPQTTVDIIILDIIKDRIDDAYCSIKLAQSILCGDDQTSAYCTARKYHRPNRAQIADAQILLNPQYTLSAPPARFSKETRNRLKKLHFDAQGIQSIFQEAINTYGISGWRVEICEYATAIDVRNKTSDGCPIVVIPTDREVTGLKLIELIGHEIECHLRDSENAAQLFYSLIGHDSPLAPLVPLLAKPDDEMLYEGHAKISDASVTGRTALPKPYYTIAQNLAVQGYSFAEAANRIYKIRLDLGESKTDAIKGSWLACYRAFRGCTDTKNPHSYTFGKDYAYLAGYNIARTMQFPEWLDFASLSLSDLQRLHSAGIELNAPRYPYLNVASIIADEILS